MNHPQPQHGSPAPAFPVFALPTRRPSAWVVETEPESTRAWLGGVMLAESIDAVQQLYRALYTLNRMELDVEDRLALMELYREPVAVVVARLQAHFVHLSLPLKPRLKQLADFLCQLHIEMAYGYKHVLEAARAERRPWESEVFVFALERSIRYLGEVLLQSYQVYMPAPAGVWREIHGLYRYAEDHDCQQTVIEPDGEPASVGRTYLQVLMLGLCGPYQLPVNECRLVSAFLGRWADKTRIRTDLAVADPNGHFLLDLDADHPAVPFPRDVPMRPAANLRVVNAIELARVAHDYLQRLQKGGSSRELALGFECIGNACRDTLRRMLRFWGLAGRRHFSRRRVRQPLSLCIGVNAIHFFASGEQPFTQPVRAPRAGELVWQAPDARALEAEAHESPAPSGSLPEIYRIDSRWQVRDESAGGVSLIRQSEVGLPMRNGDLLGLHDPGQGAWRVGVTRWIKSRDAQTVEVGIEMLAPSTRPLAARMTEPETSAYAQALWVPPVEVLHQPATLLVPFSTIRPGQGLEIVDHDQPPRRVRVLRVVEHSSAFAQVVVADEQR